MQTRILTMVLVLTMLLSLLAGCGGTAAEPTEAPATQTPATQAPATGTPDKPEEPDEPSGYTYPLAGERKTISIWTTSQPDVVNLLGSFANHDCVKYAEDAINVELEWFEVATAAGKEQYSILVAGGEYPDIIREVASKYTDKGESAIEEEILIDVKDLLPTKMPDYWNIIQNHEAKDRILEQMTTEKGHIACIYSLQDESIGPNMGPIIRGDWLEELNLESPETYEEYYEVLTAFKVAYDCSDPILLPCHASPSSGYLARGYDVTAIPASEFPSALKSFFVKDGKIHHSLLEDGYREYLTMLNKWYSEGLVNVDYYSRPHNWKDAVNTGLILNGEAGIFYNDLSAIGDLNNQATIPGFDVVGVKDAVRNKGDITHMTSPFTGCMAANLSVSTQCEDLDSVFAFLNWWYTEEGILLTNYGIQGKTWDYDSQGKPQYLESWLSGDDGLTKMQRNALGIFNTCGFLSIARRNDFERTDSELIARDIWKNDDGAYYIMATLNADESYRYNALYADILTYMQESLTSFIIGELSMETDWDAFVQGAVEMGLDECIDIWQTAQDRYAAA